jgi:hypothetical protein
MENFNRFFEFINEIIEKYPDLKQKIEKQLSDYNREMTEKLFQLLSDDALVKISEFFLEDAAQSKEIHTKFPSVPRFPSYLKD